jgi:hypothetical protein
MQFSFKTMHYFFPETVSLQNIEFSSKHAVFLSEEVQSSFQNNIRPSFNHTVVFSKYNIPTQYAVCD